MPATMRKTSAAFFDTLHRARDTMKTELAVFELGAVMEIGEGVAQISGFSALHADELLVFPNGLMGIAATIQKNEVGVILLGDVGGLRAGDDVRRTMRVVDTPVGEGLLGRVVDGLGRAIDQGGPLKFAERLPIERPAPSIMDRAPVRAPLQTGIKAIDAAIPIGRGQRELILGDRQTGKTAIAVNTIINQKAEDVICIYCAIGQRASAVARVIHQLKASDMLRRSIVVVAGGDETPGLQFVAPYVATTMAEYFMGQGRDVLIVYDDLTRHARAYRELSLLLRRPPGREAYPGDIFYVHSRLLERAAHLSEKCGGGSLTALPIVETQAKNIAAYIPTNLISITDGQIYLSPELFSKGVLPAIDIGLSVSRVGGDAQRSAYRAVASDLKLYYAQFEELETFSRFGARLDDETRGRLERGRRIRAVLKQGEKERLPVAEQMVVLLAATSGQLDKVPIAEIRNAENILRQAVRELSATRKNALFDGGSFNEGNKTEIIDLARRAIVGAGFISDERPL